MIVNNEYGNRIIALGVFFIFMAFLLIFALPKPVTIIGLGVIYAFFLVGSVMSWTIIVMWLIEAAQKKKKLKEEAPWAC